VTVFVDTSALIALLDASDPRAGLAAETFADLRRQRSDLLTHSHVLVESIALVHRRLGVSAVRDLVEGLLPLVRVRWVDEAIHAAAVRGLLASAARGVSIVDRVSFEVMRAEGIRQAFAFDRDFAVQGFELIPPPR
jgi:predicted nucleic acid-binding protein